MEVGGTLRVGDVHVPDGVKLLDDVESVVATVTAPTRVAEPEVEEEAAEAEGVEGEEEAPEGEAPAEPEAEASGGAETTEG